MHYLISAGGAEDFLGFGRRSLGNFDSSYSKDVISNKKSQGINVGKPQPRIRRDTSRIAGYDWFLVEYLVTMLAGHSSELLDMDSQPVSNTKYP